MGEQPRKILIRKEIISMKNHSVKAAEFSALLLGAVLITGAFASGCSGNDTASGIPDVQVQDQDSDQNQDQNQDQEESGDGEELKNGTASELGSLKTFSAGTLAGETFTEEDIQEKDVTVINFWSLLCGPCIAEMPDLAAFAGALPDNVQVVTVCLDGAAAKAEAGQLLETAGFEGVTLLSGDGDLLDLCWNIQYTPTTVLADSEGNLVGDAIIGGQKDLSETLLTAVNEALKAAGKEEISLEE